LDADHALIVDAVLQSWRQGAVQRVA